MDQPSAKIIPFNPDAHDTDEGDHASITPDTVNEKLNDVMTPGYQAEFDPEEAESAGAFFEDALSEDDALASTHDFAQTALHSSPPKS